MKTTTLLPRITALLLTLILLIAAVPTAAAADDGGLHLEVTSIEYDEHFENTLNITVDYENNCDYPIWVGFVNSCSLVVTTTEGTYSKILQSVTPSITIGNGSFELTLADCKGDVQTITLTELALAEHNGNPGRKISDVVIYKNGETGFDFSFSDTDDSESTGSDFKDFVPVIITVAIVFSVLVVIVIVVIIVLVTKEAKKNKQVAATFQPFSAGSNSFTPPAGMDQTVQQSNNNNNNNNNNDNFAPPPAN